MVQQCAGCELPIADKFLLKVLDRMWHTSCVQCFDCKCTLADKCFSREGKLYCRTDFYRRYGTKCSGCNQGISPNDMVRRAKNLVFHIGCFICSYCKRQISTGDELYYVGEGKFICKEDYYQRYLAAKPNSDTESETKDLSYGLEEDFDAALGTKRRGPRTTIKAKQLEALKATFAATPKPSRSIREKIAQETGLSMRVIQVWFQNRRSKERRIKQQGAGVHSSPSRPVNRSTRRSKRHRSNSQEGNNTEPQDVNNAHINYQQQAPQGRTYLPTSTYNDYYSPKSVQGSELLPAPGSNFITQSFPTASRDSHAASLASAAQMDAVSSAQNGSLFDSSMQPEHAVTTGVSMSGVW